MPDPAADKKQFLVSWEDFHRDAKKLAEKLHAIRAEWKGMLVVTKGGMVPAGIVAWELETSVIETYGMESYTSHDRGVQKQVSILKDFNRNLIGNGEGWLVIDDLSDTGRTFRTVREKLPKAHTAAIYAKPQGQVDVDTFVVSVPQDHWIYFPWYLRGGRPADPIVCALKKG